MVIVDKPAGLTSHGVLARLRRRHPGVKFGHGGTLDPMATGVLPVLCDRSTRLADFLLHGEKAYRATIRFGWATDTYDRDGQAAGPVVAPGFSPGQLSGWLAGLTGVIRQTPPPYSAVKVGGIPLYRLARQGRAPEIAPREVTVFRFAVIAWASPDLECEVTCSAGTYIRSLAHELGRLAGCGAHLAALRRTRSGPFGLAEAIPLGELEDDPNRLPAVLIPPGRLLAGFPVVSCDPLEAVRVGHGNSVPLPAEDGWRSGEPVRLEDDQGRLLALGRLSSGGDGCLRAQPVVVLVRPG